MSQRTDPIAQTREEIEFLKTRLRTMARKPLLPEARPSGGGVLRPMLHAAGEIVKQNPVAVGAVALSLLTALGPARVARIGLWAAIFAARIALTRIGKR